MKARTKDKEQAIELRKQGYSLTDISKKLTLPIGSVCVWVKDITLSEAQKQILKQKETDRIKESKTKTKLRHDTFLEKGRQLAVKYSNEPDFMAGCFLYWGEGDKAIKAVRLSNSDPEIIIFFVKWLTKYFEIPLQKLRVGLYYHTEGPLTEEEIKTFWKTTLNISDQNFGKAVKLKGSGNKKGWCPYGILRIGVSSVEINRTIFGAIKYWTGMKRESWSIKLVVL